jgi:hypothetical protein
MKLGIRQAYYNVIPFLQPTRPYKTHVFFQFDTMNKFPVLFLEFTHPLLS